ncbi:FAD binding domain-containing protein [Cerioporus squamosus]|nr:FAD binding domain-containing protein [Cerioporus squamosus]
MTDFTAALTPATESFTDVLIIGAGPAGIMCANALNLAGIKVRIVDKRPLGLAAGQADGCHPRTIEILQSYGLAEQLLKRAAHVWKAVFYNSTPDGGLKKTTQSATVLAKSARYPFGATLHQGGIEDVILESLSQHGLEVERSTVPTTIELSGAAEDIKNPDSYTAKAVLEHFDREEDKTEIVHAKFILGSDGAHSWVRKTLGIEMEGDVSDSIWGVVDMLPDTDFPDVRCQSFIHSEAGTLFTIPRENDLIRLYVQQTDLQDVIDPQTGRVDKNRTCPAKLIEQGKKIFHPYRMEAKDGKVNWWTVYVVGQRVAKRYSINDRAFIAGDACHTHSPKAGQGLNASMGDTHNLAWKLAYVLKGWADMSLLKTYESERRKFAQDLIDFDKKWSKLFSGKPYSPDNEDGITHEQFLEAFTKSSGFISGVAIHYDPSAIVNATHQHFAPNLIVGQRVPPQVFIRAADALPVEIQDLLPADTLFKILVFAGDLAVKEDKAVLHKLAEELDNPKNFVRRFGRGETGRWEVFDILGFSSAKQDKVDYLAFPSFFRPHYSKVLLDDTDLQGRSGGGGYARYGIDEHAGAIVVVRPDGYVGMVAPLDGVKELNRYFESFLL